MRAPYFNVRECPIQKELCKIKYRQKKSIDVCTIGEFELSPRRRMCFLVWPNEVEWCLHMCLYANLRFQNWNENSSQKSTRCQYEIRKIKSRFTVKKKRRITTM